MTHSALNDPLLLDQGDALLHCAKPPTVLPTPCNHYHLTLYFTTAIGSTGARAGEGVKCPTSARARDRTEGSIMRSPTGACMVRTDRAEEGSTL